MNLDELQSVRDRERQTDKLQQLRASFYADAGEFIQQLREERDRAAERAEDPFDAPEVSRLTDEIDTAEQLVEDIYENRIGKTVKAASLDAAGLPADADGLTDEEHRLFETLVADIKHHRETVLAVLDGDQPGATTTESETTEDPQSVPPTAGSESNGRQAERVSAADLMSGSDPTAGSAGGAGGAGGRGSDQTDTAGSGEDEESPGRQPGENGGDQSNEAGPDGASDGASLDRETVLVTDDVGTFVGFDDRDYDLETDDVVTLPATNAEILVEQDAARPLEEQSSR